MKVVVTGSSGRIGGAIAARLDLRHQVSGRGPAARRAHRRSDGRAGHGAARDACWRVPNAIVHTASLHVPDLAAADARQFREVNVDATRRLLQAAGEAGVAGFVYTSTTSLYGDAMMPDGGEPRPGSTEELAPQPRDIYDETKLAAEEACRDAAQAGLACICLRMSRCFPEDPRLVAMYRLYRGVDAEDVAQAHELALAAGRGGFEVYNVSAPPPFRARGLPAAVRGRGVRAPRAPSLGGGGVRRRGWQLPRSIDRVYVVDKAIAALGYRPLHDFAALFRRPAGLSGRPGGRTMSSVGYHEPVEELSDQTRDMHRAIVSLMEELEAIDWYQQRVDACKDPELKLDPRAQPGRGEGARGDGARMDPPPRRRCSRSS